MNKVYFKPSEEFLEEANKVFDEQKDRLKKLLPEADIQHIGSTSIPGSVTKGDLDINVRVTKEDYHNQLLSPAIERVAGNSLTKIDDDKEFETRLTDQINRYTSVYYKVAYKYKLPTIRIVPFLLRLISN